MKVFKSKKLSKIFKKIPKAAKCLGRAWLQIRISELRICGSGSERNIDEPTTLEESSHQIV